NMLKRFLYARDANQVLGREFPHLLIRDAVSLEERQNQLNRASCLIPRLSDNLCEHVVVPANNREQLVPIRNKVRRQLESVIILRNRPLTIRNKDSHYSFRLNSFICFTLFSTCFSEAMSVLFHNAPPLTAFMPSRETFLAVSKSAPTPTTHTARDLRAYVSPSCCSIEPG